MLILVQNAAASGCHGRMFTPKCLFWQRPFSSSVVFVFVIMIKKTQIFLPPVWVVKNHAYFTNACTAVSVYLSLKMVTTISTCTVHRIGIVVWELQLGLPAAALGRLLAMLTLSIHFGKGKVMAFHVLSTDLFEEWLHWSPVLVLADG